MPLFHSPFSEDHCCYRHIIEEYQKLALGDKTVEQSIESGRKLMKFIRGEGPSAPPRSLKDTLMWSLAVNQIARELYQNPPPDFDEAAMLVWIEPKKRRMLRELNQEYVKKFVDDWEEAYRQDPDNILRYMEDEEREIVRRIRSEQDKDVKGLCVDVLVAATDFRRTKKLLID